MFAFSLLLSLMLLWAVSLGKHASSLWLVSVSRKGTAAPRQGLFLPVTPSFFAFRSGLSSRAWRHPSRGWDLSKPVAVTALPGERKELAEHRPRRGKGTGLGMPPSSLHPDFLCSLPRRLRNSKNS